MENNGLSMHSVTYKIILHSEEKQGFWMTARPLIFYEIKSQKTEHSRDGIRQLSFACEDHPDMFCFLWIDPNQKLKHIQLLFGESVLEWKEGQGINCSQTNRIQENEIKIGVHKGSRSLHLNDDPELLNESLQIMKRCEFPESWNPLVHEIFHP